MNERRAGGRRLLAALVTGTALVGALVALQLTDDAVRPAPDAVRVGGVQASRASLEGAVAGADGWTVEITVDVGGQHRTTTVDADGRFALHDLVAGVAEVAWSARAVPSTATPEGLSIDAQRAGRARVTLEPGTNTLDVVL